NFLPAGSLLAADTSELVGQLVTLVNDAKLRKDYASKNRLRFEKHYSWQVCKNQLETVYTQL
nr:hypothetical protein [Acidiferrobacterales bacterium]